MKTLEEPNAINEEVKTLNKKSEELSEKEFTQVTGGADSAPCGCASCNYGSKEECTYYRAVNGHTQCKYNDSGVKKYRLTHDEMQHFDN